jgi:hypothetical protein
VSHIEFSDDQQFRLRVSRDDDGRYYWTIAERVVTYSEIVFSDGHSDLDAAISDAREEIKRLMLEAKDVQS